jgi:hypothetical protein
MPFSQSGARGIGAGNAPVFLFSNRFLLFCQAIERLIGNGGTGLIFPTEIAG